MLQNLQKILIQAEQKIQEAIKIDTQLSTIYTNFLNLQMQEKETVLDTYDDLLEAREDIEDEITDIQDYIQNIIDELNNSKLGKLDKLLHNFKKRKMKK